MKVSKTPFRNQTRNSPRAKEPNLSRLWPQVARRSPATPLIRARAVTAEPSVAAAGAVADVATDEAMAEIGARSEVQNEARIEVPNGLPRDRSSGLPNERPNRASPGPQSLRSPVRWILAEASPRARPRDTSRSSFPASRSPNTNAMPNSHRRRNRFGRRSQSKRPNLPPSQLRLLPRPSRKMNQSSPRPTRLPSPSTRSTITSRPFQKNLRNRLRSRPIGIRNFAGRRQVRKQARK